MQKINPRITVWVPILALCWGLQGCAKPTVAAESAPAEPARAASSKSGKKAKVAQSPTPAQAADSPVPLDTLKKRAGQTLGVAASAVGISNIDVEGGLARRVNFTATVGKSSYMCYVTSGIGVVSDAICTRPKGGGIVGSESNALLRAADGLNRK